MGDSRAYLVRGERGRQLTRDHSWVAEQVSPGRLTPERARLSSKRNVLHRALGVHATVDVDIGAPVTLAADDVIVLCSDGLHGQVTDEEIVAVAARLSIEDATSELVRLTNQRGGPDNISVIVCSVKSGVWAVHRASGGERLCASR